MDRCVGVCGIIGMAKARGTQLVTEGDEAKEASIYTYTNTRIYKIIYILVNIYILG